MTAIDDTPRGEALEVATQELRALGVRVLLAPDDATIADVLSATDLVMPSPGVRPDHQILRNAIALHVPVRSEIDLAAERIFAPIIAVTGTNGKTTTVEMITAMLVADGRRVLCGGNIGTPLISFAGVEADVVVAEASSFQLHFVTEAFRPAVAVLLNIADDHLDWHGSFDAYRDAKCNVFRAQQPDDVLISNLDDPVVGELHARRREAISEALPRPREITVGVARPADFTVTNGHLTGFSTTIIDADELPRSLPHDVTNSLVASAAALSFGVSMDAVRRVLKNYATLPHRVQYIGENRGVLFYNDSKATNPHATLRAVESFDSVVLLAGGLNKGLDLGSLRASVPPVKSVVAFGAAQHEVATAFADLVPVTKADAMSDAVRSAISLAQPGDVVLLSPACASFDMYPGGYTERGEDFSAIVRRFITEEHPA